MNVFVFGIGGTGARVLRSLTYCLAADMGDLPADVNFVPMIIDHDPTNKDKEIAVKTMEDYRNIHDAAHPNPPKDFKNFFLPGLRYLSEIRSGNAKVVINVQPSFEFEFGIGKSSTDNGTFAQYIDHDSMNGELSSTSNLLKALYNDDPAYIDVNGKKEENSLAELNLDLGKGYRGNPNIGTVVFDSIEDTNAYKYFAQNFTPGNDLIVIIGSIFGGTGSSGIPKVIEAIRTNSAPGWNEVKVACIMVMPYFKVNEVGGNNEQPPAIQDCIFKSKQKAALSFYDECMINGRNMNQNFNAIYYVAEADDRQHRNKYSEGGQDQQNNANIVDLIAATGIIDFVEKQTKKRTPNQYNEYGLKDDSQGGHELQLKHFADGDRDTYLKSLTRLALALKHFRDRIKTGKVRPSASYYGDNGLKIPQNINTGIYEDLTEFTEKFVKWLEELKDIKHSFAPYDISADELNKVVKGYVSTAGHLLNHSGVSYKDFDSHASTSWADGVKKYDNKECAFIKVLYEASVNEADFATKKPEK